MLFTSVIDTVTRMVIGILLVVAAAVVVLGLFRAYLGRRRLELVITNTVAPKELSKSLIADLSEELRVAVHRRLVRPIPIGDSLNNTVGMDLASHIADIPGIDQSEVERIQKAILRAPRQELLASPRDALAAVSGGIRALKPKEAEGFIQALSAVLPAQRGLTVGSRVVCRRETDGTRMGLSVQVGPLGHAADARATFWSQDLLGAEGDLSYARLSWFNELLDFAADWIIIYLVATLGVESAVPQHRLRLGHWRYVKQRHALLDILTAQLASYRMYELEVERPDVALEWAHQALEDAEHAKDSLPPYYYPSYLAGSIHHLWGNCYDGLSKRAPDNEKYRSQANEHFQKAAAAFAEAESKLKAIAGSRRLQQRNTGEESSHRFEAVRIARLKVIGVARLTDQLLIGDGLAGLTALGETEIIPSDLEIIMNAACLFATAAWVADKNGLNAWRYRLRACRYAVDAVRQNPRVEFLRKDKDLNRGITRADLDWLFDKAPKVDDQTKEERLWAIATGRPLTSERSGEGTMHSYYVAWWNVENLFDEENAFQLGRRSEKVHRMIKNDVVGWTPELRDRKISQLASVIAEMNTGVGPDLLGVCEVENRFVIDLLVEAINKKLVSPRKYEVIHADTSDARGIDVAFVYDSTLLEVPEPRQNSVFNHVVIRRTATRDIVQVTFKTKTDPAHTLVVFGNHWPSRSGGQYESAGYRAVAGETLAYWHQRVLEVVGPDTPVLVAGDFNDEPFDQSMVTHALSTRQRSTVTASREKPRLWNLMWPIEGIPEGSFYYDNEPNMLDQFLVNKNMAVENAPLGADPTLVHIFKPNGNAHPDRPIPFGRGKKLNEDGFSDHFPITMTLTLGE
jgi:Endonuclease/Exonuclease/phosphatase family